MKPALKWIAAAFITAMMSQALFAQHSSSQSNSSDQDHKKHHDQVNHRADHAMGFSHTKTTHHFRLTTEGGVIEVTAKEASDSASRDQIRRHLKHIAQKFSEGDFSAPMFIHGENPPGVQAMKQLKGEIKYQFEEIERGAKVHISSSNEEAVKSVHDFLRFQIKDHQTGDSIEVQ
jgi:hypothetical protein